MYQLIGLSRLILFFILFSKILSCFNEIVFSINIFTESKIDTGSSYCLSKFWFEILEVNCITDCFIISPGSEKKEILLWSI